MRFASVAPRPLYQVATATAAVLRGRFRNSEGVWVVVVHRVFGIDTHVHVYTHTQEMHLSQLSQKEDFEVRLPQRAKLTVWHSYN